MTHQNDQIFGTFFVDVSCWFESGRDESWMLIFTSAGICSITFSLCQELFGAKTRDQSRIDVRPERRRVLRLCRARSRDSRGAAERPRALGARGGCR